MSNQSTPPNDNEATSAPEIVEAESTQTVDQETTIERSVNEPQRGKSEMTQTTGSSGKGLSIFAILLSLVAIGGGAYNFYQAELADRGSQNKVLAGVSGIGSDVKVLAERMNQLRRDQDSLSGSAVTKNELKTNLLEVNTNTESALKGVAETQKVVEGALEKIAQSSQRSADKLAIDEVSQLLKLANNSAVFAGDKDSALNALRLADTQLKQLADPRYSVVRRTITQEIETLEAISTVDVATLSAALNALAKRVPDLPLENEPPAVERVAMAEVSNDEPFSVRSELKKLGAMMVNAVSVSRVDQPPKPLLSPEQRFFLDQNIQLKLNTAELAIMQQRPAIYERSVEEALTWLLDYYDPRDAGVKDVADRLRTLKQQDLAIELPSIAKSYDQLQQIKGGN